MSSNQTNEALCEVAGALSTSTALRVVDSIKICIAIFGIGLFGSVLYRKGTYIGFHRNARILLLVHHFCVFAYLLTDIGQTSFQLIWFAINRANPCDYLITTLTAIIVRTPNIYFMYVNVYGNFAIAIERLLAFVYYSSYEVTPFVGCRLLLIGFQFLITTIVIGVALLLLDWSALKTSARIASAANSKLISYTQFSQIAIEISALIICYILLYLNRRKKCRLLSAPISEKYQIDENIRVVLLIMPLAWCHIITYTISIAITTIYLLYESNTNTIAYELLTACDDTILLYPILLSIVLLIKHHHRKQRIGVLVGANQTENQTQMTAHFVMLEAAWDAHANRILASKNKKLTNNRQYCSRAKPRISSVMQDNFITKSEVT